MSSNAYDASRISYPYPYPPYYYPSREVCGDFEFFSANYLQYKNATLEPPQMSIIGLGLDENLDNKFLDSLQKASKGVLSKQWSFFASPYNGNYSNLTIGGVFQYQLQELQRNNQSLGFHFMPIRANKAEWSLSLF